METSTRRFWITLAALTGLRLAFIGHFDLSPDEAYYWTWSRHLDWGYYDQGPMIAWVIRFFTWLFGASTEWTVRCGAVVLSVVSAWLFFDLVRRLFHDRRVAWIAFLSMQAALLFASGAVLMMHDSIMLCAWIAALYFFYRALMENWSWGWLGGSLALAAGAMAKYSMVFFVAGLVLFLILSPRQRSWWLRPPLVLCGLSVLALLSPLVLWNIGHGWAPATHIANLAGSGKPLAQSGRNLLEFIGGQMGVMTPLIGAGCLAAPVIAWIRWRRGGPDAETYLYLACFSAPVLLYFLALSARTPVYANWPAPAYPAALAILAGWLNQFRSQPLAARARAWTLAGLILGAAMTLFVHLEAGWGLPPLSGRLAESLNRVRGWRDLGASADRAWLLARAADPQPMFMAARRYQIAALLSFYMSGHPEVQVFPQTEPADNQYRFWDARPAHLGHDALFAYEDDWELDLARVRFDSCEKWPTAPWTGPGPRVHDMRFALLRGLKATVASTKH